MSLKSIEPLSALSTYQQCCHAACGASSLILSPLHNLCPISTLYITWKGVEKKGYHHCSQTQTSYVQHLPPYGDHLLSTTITHRVVQAYARNTLNLHTVMV